MRVLYSILMVLFFVACKQEESNKTVLNSTQGAIVSVDFNGLQEYLDDHSAEKLVVNFWATWCKPCIQELPAFEKLRKKYEAEDVAVILVSLDFPDQLDKLKQFVDKKALQSEIVFLNDDDANTWIPKVSKKWSGAIPATLLIKGDKSEFYERSFTYEELETEVNKI